MNTPLFKGHSGALQDLDFSPFHQNMLATASADATLRLWAMPQGSLTETVDKAEAVLNGHSKKVMLMKWHPSAEFAIGSASQAGGVRIWDVQLERTQFNYSGNTAVPWSIAWNHNGSLMSLFTKEKKMHIIDPRQQAAVTVQDAHQGTKAQRVQWNGAHGLHISVGTSDFGDREYMVFDPRDWSQPVQKQQLDSNTQVCYTHYDDVCNLFFVTNKGSTFTQCFYFSAEGERQGKPELIPLSQYNGKEGTAYFYFMHKNCVDPLRKEIVRGVRFTGRTAEFITFKLPRKEADFSADLYPPHRAQTSALTFEDWAKGTNADPVFESFDPAKLQERIDARMAESYVFSKKEGAGSDPVIDANRRATAPVNRGAGGARPGSGSNAAEITRLNQEISSHKSTIAANEKTI